MSASSEVQTPAEAAQEPEPAPSIVREVVAGLIASAIALACVLPPLLHLLTGPLGPLIGGAVVGHHVKPSPRGRIIIAVTLGVSLAALGAAAAAAVYSFGGENGAPDWFPSSDSIIAVLGGVFLYATALGAAGATLGARMKGGAA